MPCSRAELKSIKMPTVPTEEQFDKQISWLNRVEYCIDWCKFGGCPDQDFSPPYLLGTDQENIVDIRNQFLMLFIMKL